MPSMGLWMKPGTPPRPPPAGPPPGSRRCCRGPGLLRGSRRRCRHTGGAAWRGAWPGGGTPRPAPRPRHSLTAPGSTAPAPATSPGQGAHSSKLHRTSWYLVHVEESCNCRQHYMSLHCSSEADGSVVKQRPSLSSCSSLISDH